MSDALHISTGRFTLPFDAVTQTLGIIAKRGMGKTYCSGVVVEEMARIGAQVIVIDPTDVWWGIKSSADGKRDGYPFIIFGGNHADVPLVHTAGRELADFLVQSGHSAIISTRLLSKKRQRALVADFFEQMYHIKGQTKHQTPVHVAIDECDAFIPQTYSGDAARCVGAIDDVVRRGRSSGFGVTLISQRPAKINKDVLSQVEVLIAMQTSGSHDRKALRDWIEANADTAKMKEFIENLVKLQRGEAWVWSPSWLQVLKQIRFRKKRTFDSSFTPSVKSKKRPAPRKVAAVDLDEVREMMAATVEEAALSDPKVLRARIVELERECQRAARVPDPDAIARAVNEALERAQESLHDSCAVLRSDVSSAIDRLQAALWTVETAPPPPSIDPDTPRSKRQPPTVSDSSLGKCELAILEMLATHMRSAMIGKIALLTGYRISGGFRNALSKLRQAGLIEGANNGWIQITDEGVKRAPTNLLPRAGADLHQYWLNHAALGKCEREILAHLLDVYPRGRRIDGIAEGTGYSVSGGFRNALSKLRTAGLIVGKNTEEITAAADLF